MPPKKSSTATVASSMEALYYKHYDECVQKYGTSTAILLQVGKFFEMYDSVNVLSGMSRANVQTVASVCGCVVDPKPTSDPQTQRIFWGFPEMSLAKFERMLVAEGYTVVVIVQNKDATGDVTSRTVDHVSSPGTFWDAEGGLAVRGEEKCILGVYISPYIDSARRQQHWYVACSAMDVMTGKIVSTETDLTVIDGKPVCDPIQPFLSTYPPAEVIVWWNSTTPPPSPRTLGMLSSTTTDAKFHQRHLAPKDEDAVAADRLRRAFLTEIFKPDTVLGLEEYLGIGMYHMVRRSLAGLLQFVKDHNPSYLANLHAHTMWTPDAYCLLGNAALEQLAMTPAGKRETECLLHWLQHAITPMGRRALRERCMKPITDCTELDARQGRVAALRVATYREPIEAELKGMSDLARLFRKFQLGRGGTDDLLQILTTYQKARKLCDLTDTPQEVKAHLDDCLKRWSAERIVQSRAQVSDAVAVGSVHPWARGVHADLDAAEDEWLELEGKVLEMKVAWERAVGDDCITWAIKDDEPFTFSIKSGRGKSLAAISKQKLKTTITLNQRGTASVGTLESPELTVANEKGHAIRERWLAGVRVAWAADWSTWMNTTVPSGVLETLIDWIGELDTEASFARVANIYGYVRPTYVESEDQGAGFSVTDLRHPILERVHTSTTYIPHSLAMGAFADEQTVSADLGVLLYGVNAAGKSSLGKAIGLAVLMAQCGIPVPASAMKIIPYTALFTRILGNDNLWAGMSSFVVEMTEFRSILRSAGPRTLVIGDELCAGTETASATSIVAAGVQTLAARGCHFFFATHLHELATISAISNNPALRSYHLTVRPDTARGGALIYDRTLRPGCGSPMYGLEVCRGLDMDREFLALAVDIRRGMFGDDGRPRLSRYNAGVVVSSCAVCGERDGLETHHITPQAAANADGFVSTGVHKNAGGNLAVLCAACHDKHHSGMLEIVGWADTSTGRQLMIKTKSA